MKVKNFLSAFLAAMMLLSVLPLTSFAAEGIQCGENAYLTYDEQSKTLTVSGEGDLWDMNLIDNLTEHEVEMIVVEEGITSVGANAFAACDVKNVRLPSTLKKIGDFAFFRCLYLEEILLPENLETIGANAFAICSVLKEIVIPESVKIMGSAAFHDCTKLERAIVNANIEMLDNFTFGNCWSLRELVLPDSLQVIGSQAMGNCFSLEKLVLPKSLQAIGAEALMNCFLLKELVLPESVETVGEDTVFENICLRDVTVFNDSLELDRSSGLGFSSIKPNEGYTYEQLGKLNAEYYEKIQTLTDEEKEEYDNLFNEMTVENEDGERFMIDNFTLHCNADSKAHEYAINNGLNHTILGSDYDCACGKHNVYVNELIPATCTENGYKGGTVCLECEKIFEAAEVIPATGHVDKNNDGRCENCGKVINRGKAFFAGIINAILALFRKLFG